MSSADQSAESKPSADQAAESKPSADQAARSKVESAITTVPATRLYEDWLAGYAWAMPTAWLEPPILKRTERFDLYFEPARSVAGHISRIDRMRAFNRKNLQESHQYFMQNNLVKGKVIATRDLLLAGRPARIMDVEYDYPAQIDRGRVIWVECEEYTYQFFFKAPFHFKEKIDPAYGNGYWEREILPIMEELERSFRALRSGVVASVVPSAGYVLCQSNHADVKFEVLQGWTSSTHKVVNGQVNLGMTSGDNFGADGIALRFDSYQRRDGSEYANLDSLAAHWHKRVTEKPTQLGRITATRDYVLNGLPARRLEMFLESGKTSYRRWIILVETPQKLVEFNLSGYETPTNPKDKSFKQVAVPAGIRLMRTISSTRKDLFGSAKLTGFQRDELGL